MTTQLGDKAEAFLCLLDTCPRPADDPRYDGLNLSDASSGYGSPRALAKGLDAYGWQEETLIAEGYVKAYPTFDGVMYMITYRGRAVVTGLNSEQRTRGLLLMQSVGFYVRELDTDDAWF